MSVFGQKVRDEAVEDLVSAVDRILLAAGFNKVGRGEWKRDAKWKSEEVDLRLDQVTRYGLQPAFRIALPCAGNSPTGETYEYFAEAKLPGILNSDAPVDSAIALPNLKFGVKTFVADFAASIESALPWFEQFATPTSCKESLKQYLKPGCPAFVDAERYLESL